jgi:O-antigen biosynthesis protein WbqP
VIPGNAVKHIFDFIMAVVLLGCLSPLILASALMVRLTSKGPVIHWSDRVGKDNKIFKMPKFRTMCVDAPDVATHLMATPDIYVTSVGSFLRKLSLDELPQLFCILAGNMSLVGPRPALFNQHDLIELRTTKNIHTLTPGITGWAQVNGRDNISMPLKVELDEYYLKNRSFLLDIKIIIMTVFKVISKEGVAH